MNKTAVLLLSCPDKTGIVSRVTHFIFERNGNIIDLDQYVDPEKKILFMRIEWNLEKFSIKTEDLNEAFSPLGKEFEASWKIEITGDKKYKVGILVSKHLHCLQDLLWRVNLDELNCQVSLIISNHEDARELADNYKIPYFHTPVNNIINKESQEAEQIKLLKEHDIDLIILARYMQILSPKFVSEFLYKIINIHHSFLPAFIGGNPYKQAFERGVKIIGATSHYATQDLDEGPIIHQDTIKISHKDSVEELKRKGRDLERIVLAEAVRAHLTNRILVSGRKTVVF